MPQRTCVGCRERTDWSRLLRVVVARSEGEPGAAGEASRSGVAVLVPDPRRRLPGRGAWLHPDLRCLELAERRRAFPRALRVQGGTDSGLVRQLLQQTAPPQ